MNSELVDRLLDYKILIFLDEFEAEFGKLPSELQKAIWCRGFVDACEAIIAAMKEKEANGN